MIITNSRQTPYQSAQFVEKQFSIRINPKLFEALGSLYTDPILAICREYMTNADEAHQLAGHNQPIRITLPTALQMELTIEDSGPGLSQDKVFELFTTYGASGDEKETSNDYEGGFGLGGKCWRSYADSIIVESKHAGTKTTYSFFLDETGMGKAAVLNKTSAKDTGITIRIPVKKDDIDTFTARAVNIGSMFPIRPVFTNLTQDGFNQLLNDNLNFQTRQCIYKTDKFTYFGDGNDSYVRMGRLVYPVESRHLPSNFSEILKSLLEAGVLINFNVSELDLAPSRETLKYTTKTVAALFGELKAMADGMAKGILKEVDGLVSEHAAIIRINELTRKAYRGSAYGSSSAERFSIKLAEKLDKKWTWQNKPLLHNKYDLASVFPKEPANWPNTKEEYFKSLGMACRVFWLKNYGNHNLQFENETEIIPSKRAAFVTTGNRLSSPNIRIKRYLNEHKDIDHVYVLGLTDAAKTSVTAKYPGLLSLPFIEADTLPLPERTSSGDQSSNSSGKSRKHCRGHVFTYKPGGHRSKRSDGWSISTDYDLNEPAMYVLLDNFQPAQLDGKTFNPDIENARNGLAMLGFQFKEIYGIKLSEKEKVKDSKWLHISEIFDLAVKKLDEDQDLRNKVYPVMAYAMANKSTYWSARTKAIGDKELGKLTYIREYAKRLFYFVGSTEGVDQDIASVAKNRELITEEEQKYGYWLNLVDYMDFDWSKIMGYEPALFDDVRLLLKNYPLLRYFDFNNRITTSPSSANKRNEALNEYITLKRASAQKS